MRNQSGNNPTDKTQENVGDQDVIGFSFASDWLRGWHEFSGPITERNKAKPVQFQITLDTRLKFVLNGPILFCVISSRKANWNSVVSPIVPYQRSTAISKKWRYNDMRNEERIIFQRGLLTYLGFALCMWNTWSNAGSCCDWIKPKVAKSPFHS